MPKFEPNEENFNSYDSIFIIYLLAYVVCNPFLIFLQKVKLVKHQNIHTREKTFQCLLCDKKFSQKEYLVKHIRTHTREKAYQCLQCDNKFSQKEYMRTM